MKSRLVLLALLVALSASASAQGVRNLYIVTAAPSSHGASGLASALWRFDNNRLNRVAALPDDSTDAHFVAVDHDRRRLVLGEPALVPTELVVVNMDSPSSVRTVPVTVGAWALVQGWFLDSSKGLQFSIRSSDPEHPKELKTRAFDLTTGEVSILPHESWVGIRREGWWGPGEERIVPVDVTVKDGRLIGTIGVIANFDLGASVPKNLAPELPYFKLIISNDTMLVLDRPSSRGKLPPAPAGRTQLEIYDKVAKSWRSESFNGGGSSVRAFGEWLAINEADYKPPELERKPQDKKSPGAENRTRNLKPGADRRAAISPDSFFEMSDEVFYGSVELLNVRTGKRYDLNTGQGDTEVLLVDGTTLYYRVNDLLFTAQLGKNNIENTREILRDENLQLAHWAFLGQ